MLAKATVGNRHDRTNIVRLEMASNGMIQSTGGNIVTVSPSGFTSPILYSTVSITEQITTNPALAAPKK